MKPRFAPRPGDASRPGTALRDGLERILRGRTGALIVLGYDKAVEALCTGGFALDVEFSATRLRELAKMDGAVILDRDATRILRAAVQLVPDPSIPTDESGTRHRTAERVAKQTGHPVISVSQSMQIIALYVAGRRYVLEDSAAILSRANQALATLERYKLRLDEVAGTLSALEIEDLVTVRDVCAVAQRLEMVRRIAREIEGYVVELGTDGRLLSLQLDELVAGVDTDRELIVRDYLPRRRPQAAPVASAARRARRSRRADLLDLAAVAKALGFAAGTEALDAGVQPARLPAAGPGAAAARPGRRPAGRPLRRPAEAARRQHRRPAGGRGVGEAGPAPSARASRGWPSPRSSSATSDASSASRMSVEPELELVAEVVARLQDVLGRHLDQVGVLARRDLLHDRLGDLGDGLRARRTAGSPPGARSRRRSCRAGVGVRRHRTEKPACAGCRGRRRGGAASPGRGLSATPGARWPRGAAEHLRAECARRRHLRAPVAAGRREIDLAEDQVDDAVEDLVLARHVVVDRHRLDAELLGQRADGQRPEPSGVGDRDRPRSTRSRLSGGASWGGSRCTGLDIALPGPSGFVLCTVPCRT